ncbi:MAG TPA: hypothetical protein VFZ34_29170 [Blastocatellia bacterium]|nr:hypothetical protein [Blastocatellia bacterium]
MCCCSPSLIYVQRGLSVTERTSAPRSEQRVALVIGNGAYKEALLLNPTHDARDIATLAHPRMAARGKAAAIKTVVSDAAARG